MERKLQNNKNVYEFRIKDTSRAWQEVTRFMDDAGFHPHEEMRDVYYALDPGVGVSYLQFFKTNDTVQVVAFLGGAVYPVPFSEAGEAGLRGEEKIGPLLNALALREEEEALGNESAVDFMFPSRGEEPARTEEGAFINGAVPISQPSADPYLNRDFRVDPQDMAEEKAFHYGPTVSESEVLPVEGAQARYDFDPVNGGRKDRGSNAIAGLVFGILGFILMFVLFPHGMLNALTLLPAAAGFILSYHGLDSDRKGMAIPGLALSILALVGGALGVLIHLFFGS